MEASIYRLRLRDLLVLCVLSLLLLGVLMVQSASTRVSGELGWDWTSSGLKHMYMAGFALVAFFFVGFCDYRKLVSNTAVSARNPIVWIWVVAVVLCLLTNIPGIGKTVNGARRWIGVGPLQLQPSELAKWAVVLLLAWILAYHEDIRTRFWKFLKVCFFIGIPCLLVVVQDFGTAALIGLAAVLIMIVGRVRWWHLAVVFPPMLSVAFWFVYHKEYRWKRLMSFREPFADPEGQGYHMVQSLLSFTSGGIFGSGLGNGVQKLGYLPEDTTDFIFAVICEELGLFGALLVITLYLGIAFVGYQLLRNRTDPFARLIVFGATTMVVLQGMINIAVATVSVPTKGLSLPLISAGGSGLVITGAALGLLYSVARIQEEPETVDELPLLLPAAPSH